MEINGIKLIEIQGDNIVVARYPGMPEELKKEILAFFDENTDINIKELDRFLNFEEDNEFCS